MRMATSWLSFSSHPAFRVGFVVGERHRRVDRLLVAPRVHGAVDVRRNLPPDHGAHVAHQTVRLAKFAALDGLGDDQENVVHLVVEVLRPQLPPEEETDPLHEDRVQLLHAGGISGPDAVDQPGPGRFLRIALG